MDLVVLTETIIKKIHELTTQKIIPDSEIGKYRRQQVVLKNTLLLSKSTFVFS